MAQPNPQHYLFITVYCLLKYISHYNYAKVYLYVGYFFTLKQVNR